MVTRLGFQRLLAEVSLDHVGLILGLEMSRLARSNKIGISSLNSAPSFGRCEPMPMASTIRPITTIASYAGLRGMMNEAELYIMKGRLLEGRRHKAQRGDLLNEPPLGYVRAPTAITSWTPTSKLSTSSG